MSTRLKISNQIGRWFGSSGRFLATPNRVRPMAAGASLRREYPPPNPSTFKRDTITTLPCLTCFMPRACRRVPGPISQPGQIPGRKTAILSLSFSGLAHVSQGLLWAVVTRFDGPNGDHILMPDLAESPCFSWQPKRDTEGRFGLRQCQRSASTIRELPRPSQASTSITVALHSALAGRVSPPWRWDGQRERQCR